MSVTITAYFRKINRGESMMIRELHSLVLRALRLNAMVEHLLVNSGDQGLVSMRMF